MLGQHESEILNGRAQRLSFCPGLALRSALRVANFQMKKDNIKRKSRDLINSYGNVYIVNFLMNSFRVHTKTKQSTLSIASFFSDVDECVTGVHKCEQGSTACNNTQGSYICQCKNGYQPAQSLYKCQGNADNNTTILFSLNDQTQKICIRNTAKFL